MGRGGGGRWVERGGGKKKERRVRRKAKEGIERERERGGKRVGGGVEHSGLKPQTIGEGELEERIYKQNNRGVGRENVYIQNIG